MELHSSISRERSTVERQFNEHIYNEVLGATIVYIAGGMAMKAGKRQRNKQRCQNLSLYEDMIDHRSYNHNLSNCGIKA